MLKKIRFPQYKEEAGAGWGLADVTFPILQLESPEHLVLVLDLLCPAEVLGENLTLTHDRNPHVCLMSVSSPCRQGVALETFHSQSLESRCGNGNMF